MLALDRLNLTIGRGEFVSLLGPSGCGKSTILYILAGLVKATAGRVDIADMRAGQGAEAPIGFVFQEASLLPWATVAENIALPLTLGRRTGADRAKEVRRCLDMVGLEAFAGAYPRELSGGMKMRVSIARALITRPQLLLLDERQTGCTIVMVTHNTTESVYLSSWQQDRAGSLALSTSTSSIRGARNFASVRPFLVMQCVFRSFLTVPKLQRGRADQIPLLSSNPGFGGAQGFAEYISHSAAFARLARFAHFPSLGVSVLNGGFHPERQADRLYRRSAILELRRPPRLHVPLPVQ
ncbi:ABC transporter ATP-binding protein [Rhizobium leguminosarum]